MRKLDRLRKEWKAGTNLYAEYDALGYCEQQKMFPPRWVFNAVMIHGLEAKIKEVRKERESRRNQRRDQDASIHSLILSLRHAAKCGGNKLGWEEAYKKTAEIAATYDGSKLTADQVKNAYVRVRRLEKVGKVV